MEFSSNLKPESGFRLMRDMSENQKASKSARIIPKFTWRLQRKTATLIIVGSFSIFEFLRGVDAGVLPAIASSIAQDLHASSVDAYWSGSAYLFGMTMTQPIFGGLAQTVGRRTCTMVSVGTFILANLLCAIAKDIHWLIGTRLVCSV